MGSLHPYDPQGLQIPTIEEEAMTMLNANIQQNQNDNVDIEVNKLQQVVESVKKEL